ncbi:hypothetical protein C2845_PM07G04720 [Panicum miliaceum]|uniref:Uncharacterized protein n=1 Tax=Panicum miliaceum TaxID=4540 RepID=A0A3L6SRL0_PANMI|nr:hypothetical protein C2845_PM07G04720 [Panicum miliaceum]
MLPGATAPAGDDDPHGCLAWLARQPTGSVAYVDFGTVTAARTWWTRRPRRSRLWCASSSLARLSLRAHGGIFPLLFCEHKGILVFCTWPHMTVHG